MAVGQYRDDTAYSDHFLAVRDQWLSQTVPESKYYNHSHLKWIWLISNDQLRCNQSNKDNLLYIWSFWPFHLWLQAPNQVLAPEAKALTSKAEAKVKD